MDRETLYCTVLYGVRLWDSNIYTTLLKGRVGESLIYVYDNSPVAQHTPSEFEGRGIHYVSDPTNSGLSRAYNSAARYATQMGCRWIMLLDQDTSIPDSIVEEFNRVRSDSDNSDIGLFVPRVRIADGQYISPVRIKHHLPKLAKTTPIGRAEIAHYTAINSGMIISIEAFWSVGGYNERVWLDYSDHEFVARFKRCYDYFYTLSTQVDQRLSILVDNSESRLRRFEIMCECIKGCDRDSLLDHIDYLIIVVRRTLLLIFLCRSLTPLKIFMRRYIL